MAAHAASPTPAAGTRRWSVRGSAVIDAATYWSGIAAIYVAYGFLWYFAAKEKLIDDGGAMPAGLAKQFDGSILASVPGLDASWVLLGVLEAVAFLAVAASLLAGEFLPQRRKPLLLAALAVSMLTFAAMSFAQNVIAQHDSVASLITYLGVTGVVFALVRFAPPFRGPAE